MIAIDKSRAREMPWEAHLIYAATFPVFVLAFLAARLVPLAASQAGGRRSVIGEAREAARTCVAFAFMG